MFHFLKAADWKRHPQSENWTAVLPVQSGRSRFQLVAFWPNEEIAQVIVLEPPPVAKTHKLLLRNIFSTVDDFPSVGGRAVVARCARPPMTLAWRTFDVHLVAPALIGALPRSLYRSKPIPSDEVADLGMFSVKLDAGELDWALERLAEACLRNSMSDLRAMTGLFTAYLAAHPMHRSDRVGMFVAALAGVRSRG